MSGYIGNDGVQWERCNMCGDFTPLESLHYEAKSEQYPHGRDLCPFCKVVAA